MHQQVFFGERKQRPGQKKSVHWVEDFLELSDEKVFYVWSNERSFSSCVVLQQENYRHNSSPFRFSVRHFLTTLLRPRTMTLLAFLYFLQSISPSLVFPPFKFPPIHPSQSRISSNQSHSGWCSIDSLALSSCVVNHHPFQKIYWG
jgi:hypothetical protein